MRVSRDGGGPLIVDLGLINDIVRVRLKNVEVLWKYISK